MFAQGAGIESILMSCPSSYEHLFKPIRLRAKTARNRLVVPAMATHFAEPDGSVGDRLRDYLQTRAQGGFGIVVTENLGVHSSGRLMARMAMADTDARLPGLTLLARAIRTHGALAIGQINHGGRQTSSRITGGRLLAPSAIPCPLMKEMPHALEADQIIELQEAYIAAALRVQTAGFDGVEIHAAHGYLAASFLSAYSNRRADKYGGALPNRLRFLLGIVDGIRARAAPDFLLLVRLSVEEFVPGGLVPEEVAEIGRRLEVRGCDGLSLSVGVYESYHRLTMLSGEPEGPWLDRAAIVRRAVGIPVVGVGRIKRPQLAEVALAAGKVDLVAIGRGSITNPDFPNRVLAATTGAVACMSCNICLGRAAQPEMTCPLNPFVGRERALPPPAPRGKGHILIQGAGLPALTAAWLAGRSGFHVAVAPGPQPIGGMQAWRACVPGQDEYAAACRFVAERAWQGGAQIVSGHPDPRRFDKVWRERRWEPRAEPLRPAPGVVTSTYAILAGSAPALGRRVLLVGDDLATADAALLLSERGHAVTLRSSSRDLGFDAHPGFRIFNRRLLEQRGAVLRCGVQQDRLYDGHPYFDALVQGRAGPADPGDNLSWRCDWGDAETAEIDDCYEPGALTRAVYKAVSLAEGFVGTASAC